MSVVLITFGILLLLVALTGHDHAIIEPDDLEDEAPPTLRSRK